MKNHDPKLKKDFQKWHKIKARLHNSDDKQPFFHEREIWFCSIGENVGFEQDGRGEDFLRPVVIIRKFNNEIFWAVPLTKSDKKYKESARRYYHHFSFVPGINSAAILSQIRLIDVRRLSRHIGTMADSAFDELTKKLKALLP